ncbi:S-methyl-5-thioribose-1-phosphate isomerase [bacterium]|nr:S-methyl-5-thioribose-1-phosphate isomerase [bacterium]
MRGLYWDGESLHFIEQTKLPHSEEVIVTRDWRVIVDAIKRLAIRGAPAIGVAAAFACVLAWREDENQKAWNDKLELIESARPTAVNLSYAVRRIRETMQAGDEEDCDANITSEAEKIAIEDDAMCESIAKHGIQLFKPGTRVLTHCNTGALVTYGIGTALGIIQHAWQTKNIEQVYACEARPLGQGSRLTMWELGKLGIPATLLTDSASGRLMQDGKIDCVILGADRIAANGDTANKVGTFILATLASRFEIPFYVAAPSTTFDLNISSGQNIEIEYRDADEVRNCYTHQASPKDVNVYNPAFDITPAELITAIIREDGVFYPPYDFTERST